MSIFLLAAYNNDIVSTKVIHQIRLRAQSVLDSRGNPTVSVEMTDGEFTVEAKVPSGKSAGTREAKELRDRDSNRVDTAVDNVNKKIAGLLHVTPLDPMAIDRAMIEEDGTADKSHLGANAMLAVSMASRRLAALHGKVPLWRYIARESETEPAFPKLYMNMLNGGVHADFKLPFQEYIVIADGKDPQSMYQKASNVFGRLGRIIARRYKNVPMGDEGGFVPPASTIERPFELLREAIAHDVGVHIGIDAAASELYHGGMYVLGGIPHTREELLSVYEDLAYRFNLRSIEDPFDENDIKGFQSIMRSLGGTALIVGDDLTVTNPAIVRRAAFAKAANAMIVKPNQIGTLAEVYEAVNVARDAGWKLIASHRSGETDDTFIADLAVGIGAYGIKAGAPTQRQRRVKYERLLAIGKEFETARQPHGARR